jgi:multidrug resistance protein, MATE family
LDLYVGVARGCGWQKIGAWVNLGAFYIVGVPAAYIIAFVLRAGGMVRCSFFSVFFIFFLFLWNVCSLDFNMVTTTHEQGLWTGIICGIVVQVLLLVLITLRTDWQKEVRRKVQLLSSGHSWCLSIPFRSFHAAVQY